MERPRLTSLPQWSASPDRLEPAIASASKALLDLQRADGHWAFELEADATIPAEFILLQHYLGEIDGAEERRIARYLRAIQADHGGWPLFHGGAFDMSATVKAYFALKATGDSIDAPHMARARAAILARGGAARSNVFTRILLALFGEVPWRCRAGHAGRDHVAARLVPVPSQQDFLLVADGHRAAAGADGAASAGAQSAAGSGSGNCSRRRPSRSRTGSGPPTIRSGASPLPSSTASCASSSRISPRGRGSARSTPPSPSSTSASTARTGSGRSIRRWPTAS